MVFYLSELKKKIEFKYIIYIINSMEIYNKLPEDVSNKIFMHFSHPVAELVKFHHRSESVSALMKDIRDYPESLKRLYKLPFARDHDGVFGRASLLNRLWINLDDSHRSYYSIWERLYCIKSRERAKHFIGNCYAIHPHKFQIEFLWKLYTPEERADFLRRFS